MDEAVARFDGKQVKLPARGRRPAKLGVAAFLGEDAGLACYELRFEDGSTMRVRPSAVEPMLATQSAGRVAAVRAATAVSQLPKEWKLGTYEHARRCLTTLAPGHWTEGHVVGLVMQATQFASEPAASYHPPNPSECVSALADAV